MGRLLEGFKKGRSKIRFFLHHVFQLKVKFMADEPFGERGPSCSLRLSLFHSEVKTRLPSLSGCCKEQMGSRQ